MKLQRYFKLVLIFVSTSINAQLEYRMNFVVSLAGALLAAGGALFGLLVLAGDGQPIGGWSYREATVVVGLFTIVEGFIGGALRPNLNKIGEAIRTGTMDFTLLKPIDAQFFSSTRNINIFPLLNVGVGLLVIGWALPGIPGVTASRLLLSVVLLGSALAIVYAIWFMLTTTAFWFVKIENITELFNGLFRAGQFPVTAFPGWVRVMFTFIIPVAFITTVPAEAVVGRIDMQTALAAFVIALALLLVSRWLWSYAIRSYTSASS